jgi:hypothetical protein
MSTLLNTDQAQPFSGLGTWTFTVVTAGQYTLSCQATLPLGSNLQIVLAQTGSASNSVTVGGSSTNPSATQPALGTSTKFQCAAGDVLTVTLTSSNAVDSLPNGVSGTINLFLGYME